MANELHYMNTHRARRECHNCGVCPSVWVEVHVRSQSHFRCGSPNEGEGSTKEEGAGGCSASTAMRAAKDQAAGIGRSGARRGGLQPQMSATQPTMQPEQPGHWHRRMEALPTNLWPREGRREGSIPLVLGERLTDAAVTGNARHRPGSRPWYTPRGQAADGMEPKQAPSCRGIVAAE